MVLGVDEEVLARVCYDERILYHDLVWVQLRGIVVHYHIVENLVAQVERPRARCLLLFLGPDRSLVEPRGSVPAYQNRLQDGSEGINDGVEIRQVADEGLRLSEKFLLNLIVVLENLE